MATIEHVQSAVPERPQTSLASLLARGGRVVVVGGRTTNFPQHLREDPRLVFFDSTDPQTQRRDLPSNTRAVIVTRFVDHSLYGRILEQAKNRGAMFVPGTRSTGEVRAMLEEIVKIPLPERPKEPEIDITTVKSQEAAAPPMAEGTARATTTTTPEQHQPVAAEGDTDMPKRGKMKVRRGELVEFVKQFGRLDAPRKIEGERLLPLAKGRGIDTTLNSILQSLWRIDVARRRQGKIAAQKPPRPNGHSAPPPAPSRPNGHANQTRQASSATQDDLLAAIAEARRYIADMRAAADLLDTELLPKLEGEVKRFREKQQRASQVMAEFLE